MHYTVFLKRNEEKRLLAGHSWVYANEVSKIEGKDKNGALVDVCAFDGRFIGKGYINHASKILVRIFIRNNETDAGDFYFNRLTLGNNVKSSATKTVAAFASAKRTTSPRLS